MEENGKFFGPVCPVDYDSWYDDPVG